MNAMYGRHGGEPVTVNAKMDYRPSWDSIVYVEGMRSIKVELYYISGPRGEAKRITLDRTLVDWVER